MPKFVGSLIGFQRWLVVSFTGLKCGKGKLIEAFVFAVSSLLLASLVQKLFCCWGSVFRGCGSVGWNIAVSVVLESQKVSGW